MNFGFGLSVENHARCIPQEDAKSLIHHSDRGSQYLSIRYTGRLNYEGIKPSVGSDGGYLCDMHWLKRSSACTRQKSLKCFVQALFPQLGVRTFSWTVYAAKFKLLRYSNGLIAPRDILILCSLYQCKYLFSISINSAMLTPNHFLL